MNDTPTPPLLPLSPEVCAAGQLAPADLQSLADAGFKSVINNRPDYEGGPGQPTSESMAVAAEAAGLRYAFLPVNGGYQSPAEVARFRELLESLPKPVLAFCRSGARSSKLFQAATAED